MIQYKYHKLGNDNNPRRIRTLDIKIGRRVIMIQFKPVFLVRLQYAGLGWK